MTTTLLGADDAPDLMPRLAPGNLPKHFDALADVHERRARIEALRDAAEAAVAAGAARVECPLRELFSPGLYCREIFMPAGICVVGQVHLVANINFVLGDVTVFAPELEREFRITGWETFVKPAGTGLALFMHADTWWTTVHPNPTDERDPAKLLGLIAAPTFARADQLIAERAALLQ